MAINRIDPQASDARANPSVRPPAPPNRTAQAAAEDSDKSTVPIGGQVRSAPNATTESQAPPPIPVRQARLRIDEDTRRVITQIVNEDEEVIKQIPAEEVLKIAERFRRLQGLLFDEKS